MYLRNSTDGDYFGYSDGNISDTANISYKPTQTDIAIILVIFGFVLLVGIVGNILVMIIIVAVKSMQTTINKCLFSLALADLVILTIMPILLIQADFTSVRLQLGKELCEFLIFYDRGAVFCSILSFFYVTIDRYFALCYPLRSRAIWTGRKTYAILAAIWIISLASSSPYLYTSRYEEVSNGNNTYYFCYWDTLDNKWMMWYDTFFTVLALLIPIPVLLFLYGSMVHQIRISVPKHSSENKGSDVNGRRGRGQVVVSLLMIVVVYIVSYLPIAFLQLFNNHFPTVFSWWPYDERIFRIAWFTRILINVNSAANPVICFSLSSNFRKGFLRVFCCRGIKKSQKQPKKHKVLHPRYKKYFCL